MTRSARAAVVRCGVLLVCAAGSGCATVQSIASPPDDYHAYRRYRLAPMIGERLSAAWDYLRAHPRGTFSREVRTWFFPNEQRFFEQAGHTPGGAAAYLEILPDGPHAQDERDFLRAVEREKIDAPLRAKKALEDARRRARELREALGEGIEEWTRRAVAITAWAKTLADLDRDDKAFATPFRNQEPYARCTADVCVKAISFTYAIPEANPPRDRTVTLEVRVSFDKGPDKASDQATVASVVIGAPKGGFTWWLEGAENRPVDPTDPATRAEALTRAKNRVEKVVRDVRGPACTTGEEGAFRVVDCGGVRVTIAPSTGGGDDQVRIVAPVAP